MQFTFIDFMWYIIIIFVVCIVIAMLVIVWLLRRGTRVFVRVQKGQNEKEYRAKEDDFLVYWNIGGRKGDRQAVKMSFPRLRFRGGFLDRIFYVMEGDIATTTVLTIQDRMTKSGKLDDEELIAILNDCAEKVDAVAKEENLDQEAQDDLMASLVRERISEEGMPEGMYSFFTQQVTSLNVVRDIISGITTSKWLILGSFIFGLVSGVMIVFTYLLYSMGVF